MSRSPQRFSAIWGTHLFAPFHRFCHEPDLRQLASKLLFRKDIRVSVFGIRRDPSEGWAGPLRR
jgi:hypothetical protein